MEYNGSGMIAMTGKNCVAICSDTRFGVQQVTVGTDFQRIFQMHDKLFMGLPGLGTDVLTLYGDCTFIFLCHS
jgi:20S proteasome subunit beta 3